MKPFNKCPVCGGELENKQVEKLLRGGGNIVSMKVSAEVCLHCGERLYTEDVVKSFEEIRNKLQKQEFSHFKVLGQSFTIEEDWPNKQIQPTYCICS
jgi:YgiT-type zinc finger domain-containing protein